MLELPAARLAAERITPHELRELREVGPNNASSSVRAMLPFIE